MIFAVFYCQGRTSTCLDQTDLPVIHVAVGGAVGVLVVLLAGLVDLLLEHGGHLLVGERPGAVVHLGVEHLHAGVGKLHEQRLLWV